MLHILLLFSDHGTFKLFLTVTNKFVLITLTFLTYTWKLLLEGWNIFLSLAFIITSMNILNSVFII